ncbi:MAG: Rrf2 family transcriptional regulator [Candidatus Cloacimonadota bacterium]|nr:MAG: Rrf2 family transcriptional regulator [Candidatus Cloacimonadota bacterium]PIE79446.1 MAG: Rrf2 family transcriptional regulator [Candidatus Delongbacteria bacterium]
MNLLNISEGASLAMHSLALIVKKYPKRMNAKSLAEELGASQSHLSKIFQRLTKMNLVNSLRGPAGGFELNVSAKDISFLDIYESIEGKVIVDKCPLGKKGCAFENCIFSSKINVITKELYNTLKEIKLSDFEMKN